MKKIKKWQIVTFIILSIGGYWISQNMWIFQVKIPQEEYEKNIIGTWVSNDNDLYFWEESNALTTSGIQEIGRWEKRRLYWEIKDGSINIYGKYIPDSFRKSCSQNNVEDCQFDGNLGVEFKSSIEILGLTDTYLILRYDKKSSENKRKQRVIFKKYIPNV